MSNAVLLGVVCAFSQSLIGLILMVAATSKLADPAGFRTTVRQYQLLPGRWASSAAVAILTMEFVISALLITGSAASVAAAGAAALFGIFAAAIAINLVRGRSHIACGCFGQERGTPIKWRYVARNLVLALWAVCSSPVVVQRQLPTGHGMAIIASATVSLACYWLVTSALTALRRVARAEAVLLERRPRLST